MNEESLSFDVKMTAKELFRFKMYHVYHKASGVISILLSVVALVGLITSYQQLTETMRVACIIVPVYLLIFDPIRFYRRSRTQVKKNRVYSQPLSYEVNPDGITLSQGDQTQQVKWDHFIKIVETKHQFLLYTNAVAANIIPKKDLGNDVERLAELLKKYKKNTDTKHVGR